jgi:hypothetical protein
VLCPCRAVPVLEKILSWRHGRSTEGSRPCTCASNTVSLCDSKGNDTAYIFSDT